jgi:SAM-dependent methyltransferase
MYLKTSKVTKILKESVAAKEHWKLKDSHPAIYKQPAHYVDTIFQFIKHSHTRKILEFGCGSGRNLNQINDHFEKQDLDGNLKLLKGIDINQHLIEYGQKNFSKNLELIVGDEHSIKKEKSNFYDLIFTVSVLDHIPDPLMTIKQLIKKTKRYIIFVEPFYSGIKKSEKIENEE